jgi:hypothetical protein
VADRVLNEHFSGTYSAFLVLGHDAPAGMPEAVAGGVTDLLEGAARESNIDLTSEWETLRQTVASMPAGEALDALIDSLFGRLDGAGDDEFAIWDEAMVMLEDAQTEAKVFQAPKALAFIQGLQAELKGLDVVGKSNSVADIVTTVHRELRGGDATYFTIPSTAGGVAQTLLSYESSHRPQDLWHFLRPDYRSATVWLQLKSGVSCGQTTGRRPCGSSSRVETTRTWLG